MFGGTAAIQSQNIVGYAQTKLQKNGLTIGAQFIPVSGKSFDLVDLKVTGYAESTEADVQVQTLDEFGRTVANYAYYDVSGELTAWVDDDDNEVVEGQVTFQPGEGLWSMTTGDGFGVQTSGQIATSDVSVELQQNGLSIANPTPLTIDLADCLVEGYDGSTEADVQVQTLDEFGRTVANYAYYDVPGELTAWVDDGDNELEAGKVTIKPGQGLWTMSTNGGFFFVFPGVSQ